MESFEKRGVWWLPDNETKKVPGILRFSPVHGVELQLLGALGSGLHLAKDPYPVILGFADGLGKVSLEECLPVGLRVSLPGISCEAYSPSIAYTGAHFADPESETFFKARLTFDHLPDWVQQSGISVRFTTDGAVQTPLRTEYTHPSRKEASTEHGRISIGFSASTRGDLLREFAIQQNTWVDVEPLAAQTFEEIYLGLVSPLQSFLTLATGHASVLTSLTLFTPNRTIPSQHGRPRMIPIKVYFRSRSAIEAREGRLFPQDMLFTLQDIADRFEDVVTRWLRVSTEVESGVALFTSTHFAPKMHADRLFLALAQAAETYHRTRYESTMLPPKQFERRKRRVLEICPTDLKNWLRTGFQWMNEAPFKQRLEELVKSSGECVRPLAGGIKKFIRKIVDTRNYYTHYSAELRTRAARGMELYLLAQKLSVLVRSCLLDELGFSASGRRRLFMRNKEFAFLLSESPASMERELFTCSSIPARNELIEQAHQTGRYTQSLIAALVGLHPSSVSHILKNRREVARGN